MPMKVLCLEGRPLYLSACCCVIGILGFLQFFVQPIVGLVIGVIMIALAVFGCFGSWFKSKKILFYFIVGTGILALINLGKVIYDIIEQNWFGLVVDIFALGFYGGCVFLAFSISRDKSWFSLPSMPV
eukprot:TRINITY_DN6949_c0_g1_i1.p1 TRINITY_DN6949_c0_g1~~TRINITY_DN6949_c0_g1_i1.p1  ORF type:complete len:128 (+),score=33.35 TRINITY_DN6949_c0_g1_i1:94-477(+)